MAITITIPYIAAYTLHCMCIVLPTGIRQKHQEGYLGTAQQCTEVSTLLWVQGLAQCRKIVCMYATKLLYT